jgi:type II secretion system protein L
MKPMQVHILRAKTGQIDGWARFDGAGVRLDGGSGPGPAAGAGMTTVLIVPGSQVALIPLQLPARLKGEKARIAAQFAVEDQLGQGIGGAHLALSLVRENQHALVVDPVVLDGWLEQARAQDITPDAVFPVHALLPSTGDMTCDVGDEQVIRIGSECVAIDLEMDERAIAALGLASTTITRVDLDQQTEWARDRALADPSGGLLQGRYGAGTASFAAFKPWQTPLIAACLAGVMGLGLMFAQGVAMSRAASEIEARAMAQYVAAYPNAAPVRNLRADVRARLGTSATGSTSTLTLVSGLFSALEGANTVKLDALRVSAQDGALNATLTYSDYAALQAMGTALNASGISFVEGTSRARGEVMVTEIRIGSAG